MCQFSSPTEKDIARLVSVQYGVASAPEDVIALGRRCIDDERAFNRQAGFTADEVLACFWDRE